MPAAKEFVDVAIRDNKVVVFSKTYCPFCTKAKTALKSAGLSSFTVIELDQRNDGDSIQDYLLALTSGRSVPRVFIGQKFVGGGDDVARLQSNSKLKPMLQQAGAL